DHRLHALIQWSGALQRGCHGHGLVPPQAYAPIEHYMGYARPEYKIVKRFFPGWAGARLPAQTMRPGDHALGSIRTHHQMVGAGPGSDIACPRKFARRPNAGAN